MFDIRSLVSETGTQYQPSVYYGFLCVLRALCGFNFIFEVKGEDRKQGIGPFPVNLLEVPASGNKPFNIQLFFPTVFLII